MKKYGVIGLCLMFILAGCVGSRVATQPDTVIPVQKIELEVKSVDAAPITVVAAEAASGESVEERRLQLDREKWDAEKKAKERERLKDRFSRYCDWERDVPVFSLYSYISISDWKSISDDFDILVNLMGHKKIVMLINSGGGDAFSGMGIADVLTKWKNKGIIIEGHASGLVASAAVPIFAACSTRYAGPSTMFMVHEASLFKFFSQESHSDIISQKNMMDELRDRYCDIMASNSKVMFSDWVLKIKETTWFSAKTAFEWGVVDILE